MLNTAAMDEQLSLDDVTQPQDCTEMKQVRKGVDAVDRAMVALLAVRFGYMRAAARIKEHREQVRDEDRKSEVVENVAYLAQALGLPDEILAKMWDDLVEASISYEMHVWEQYQQAEQERKSS